MEKKKLFKKRFLIIKQKKKLLNLQIIKKKNKIQAVIKISILKIIKKTRIILNRLKLVLLTMKFFQKNSNNYHLNSLFINLYLNFKMNLKKSLKIILTKLSKAITLFCLVLIITIKYFKNYLRKIIWILNKKKIYRRFKKNKNQNKLIFVLINKI